LTWNQKEDLIFKKKKTKFLDPFFSKKKKKKKRKWLPKKVYYPVPLLLLFWSLKIALGVESSKNVFLDARIKML